MPLDIQYGVLKHGGLDFVGITHLIKSIGTSPQLVHWEIEKAVLRFKKELDAFKQGKITGTEFNNRTKIDKLKGEAKEARKIASTVGNQRHSMLEAFATGDSEALAHYKSTMAFQFNAVDSWLIENQAEILLSEFQVANDSLFVHGRADVYIKTSKGKGVFDLKNKENVYLEQKLQVAFYANSSIALTQSGDQVDYSPDFASVLLLTDRGIQERPVENLDGHFELLKLYREIFNQKRELAA